MFAITYVDNKNNAYFFAQRVVVFLSLFSLSFSDMIYYAMHSFE